MFDRKSMLAAAAAVVLTAPALAGGRPLHTQTVEIGGLSGITYYTSEPNGYRVVVALNRHGSDPAVRFETTLMAGQDAEMSIPQELGLQAQAVRISRIGDDVTVRQINRNTALAE